MQLQIKREEKKVGLIFKKTEYVIRTQLLVSEEERMAMKKLDFDDLTIIEPYEFHGHNQGSRKVGYWTDKGITVACGTLPEALNIEEEIKSAAKQMKDSITGFIESGAETESEELIEL